MNYAVSGLVDWTIAALFIAGGLVGGFFGMRAAVHLAANRRMLTSIFATVIFVVAIYMLIGTGLPLWHAFRCLVPIIGEVGFSQFEEAPKNPGRSLNWPAAIRAVMALSLITRLKSLMTRPPPRARTRAYVRFVETSLRSAAMRGKSAALRQLVSSLF